MASFRRRLRLWAAASLIWQAVSLSALVPRACCAAHQPSASEATSSGAPICPMHEQAAPTPAKDQCSLSNTCSGPVAVLAALLANQGLVAESPAFIADRSTERAAAAPSPRLIRQLLPPDSPPPRA